MAAFDPDLKFDLLGFCKTLKQPFMAKMLSKELIACDNERLKSLITSANKVGGYLHLLVKQNYIKILGKAPNSHANIYEIVSLDERKTKIVKPLTRNAKAILELSKTFDGDFTFQMFKAKLIKVESKIVSTLSRSVISNYFGMLERRRLIKIQKTLPKKHNLYRVIKRD